MGSYAAVAADFTNIKMTPLHLHLHLMMTGTGPVTNSTINRDLGQTCRTITLKIWTREIVIAQQSL